MDALRNAVERGLWLVPATLFMILVAALVLSVVRTPRQVGLGARSKLVEVFLIGIAGQCAHLFEEFANGIHAVYPPLINMRPLSAELFVGFNLFALGVWVLAAFGVLQGRRIAYFPIWFFGLGMCFNGIVHPLLALWAGGYFPGLVTSPVVGILGFIVTKRLIQMTETGSAYG